MGDLCPDLPEVREGHTSKIQILGHVSSVHTCIIFHSVSIS